MKVIKLLLACILFSTTAYASYAPEPLNIINSQNMDLMVSKSILEHQTRANLPMQAPRLSENDISGLLVKYSQSESISDLSLLKKIMWCESRFNPTAKNESEIEMSYGLVQINIKAHTNITYEQAIDPDFAVQFLLENYRKGKAPSMWFNCYRQATSDRLY